ncbi:MAG: neutral zinc metallopeptidase, partial [Chloroflexota bacterium]|nr:neutral zinc metallopeptidase [Chloroflexota bacterium]
MAKRGFMTWRWCNGWIVIAVLALLFPQALGVSAQTPTPAASGYRVDSRGSNYQGAFADLAQDIDAFWEETFAEFDAPYTSPAIVTVDRRIETACGPVEPIPNALYCPGDHTIYLMPDFLADLERDFGDYAPMTVLGHEWGHHVQALLEVPSMDSETFELQADCLVGVFTRHARDTQLLDVGDFIEALNTSESAGDPIALPVDYPGAHGSPEDRVLALTEGFWLGPADGCRAPLHSPGGESEDAGSTEPTLFAPGMEQPVLLRALPLPRPGCFRPQDGGLLTFNELTDRFTDSYEAQDLLEAWNWKASAVREFTCATAGNDEVNWFETDVHRFGDAAHAHEAADYFASVRASAYGMQTSEVSGIGEYAVSLSGSAPDGEEFTLYISQGAWLARVTGVSDRGDPEADVFTVARGLLAAQPAVVEPGQWPDASAPAANMSATFLPILPAVPHAACFVQDDRGAYRFQNFADKMDAQGFSAEEISDMAWRDGAFVMFSCDDASSTKTEYIDIVIHSFATEDAADAVFPFVEAFYEPGDHEERACDLASLLVICVDGR